jgi:hypothetical protein
MASVRNVILDNTVAELGVVSRVVADHFAGTILAPERSSLALSESAFAMVTATRRAARKEE